MLFRKLTHSTLRTLRTVRTHVHNIWILFMIITSSILYIKKQNSSLSHAMIKRLNHPYITEMQCIYTTQQLQ